MSTFKDYNDVTDRLILPINGKNYTIPEVTTGGRARWERAQAGEGDTLTDPEFEHIFMGDVLDEMRADNVPEKALDRALSTAFAFALTGHDAAEIFWETGGYPKAVEAYVKAHQPNRASRRSTSTGAANTTPSRKRGSGTKPHLK